MARRFFSNTALQATLTAGAAATDTTLSVSTIAGLPAVPFSYVLDRNVPASLEVVEVTGVSGTTLTVTRGVDGTTAVAHGINALAEHTSVARDFDEANAHVNTAHVTSIVAGSNVTVSASTGAVTINATGNVSSVAGRTGAVVLTAADIGSVPWANLTGVPTLTNTVTASGAGITASPTSGAVVIANTGVTSIVAGSNVTVSGATGAVTINASAAVASVAGRTGAVTLTAADIAAGTFPGAYTVTGALTGSSTIATTLDTPTTGTAGTPGLRSGSRALVFSYTGSASAFSDNAYYDGTSWRQYSTSASRNSLLWLSDGSLTFFNTPSVAAGAVATLATRFSVDAVGNTNTGGTLSENGARVYSANNPPAASQDADLYNLHWMTVAP